MQSALIPLLRCFALALAVAATAVSAKTSDPDADLFPLRMPAIHPTAVDSYLCTPVRVSEERTYYIKGFHPNATMHTAHHMLVYGCEEPGSDVEEGVWNCGEMAAKEPDLMVSSQPCKSKPQIVYAWAKDAPDLEMPDEVAFRVGKDTDIKYLVLQVHYAHLDAIPETGDVSGVLLEYSPRPEPKVAGVLLLGTGGLTPPHATTFFETACEVEDGREIHPFAFRVHTHKLGKVVSGWKVSDSSKWSLIGKQNPQLPQMFYPVFEKDMVIRRGDHVAARCTMVNHLDHTVEVGTTGDDEMCNFYIMYWVSGGKPVTPNTCFSQGPPLWSWGGWEYGAGLRNIPDLEASTL